MLAVISPAKTLDFESPLATQKYSLPEFAKQSEQLIKRLRQYPPEEISSLMNISEKLAELNHGRYRNWHSDFASDEARAAILAFKGDVYLGLDAPSMSERDFNWAQNHLRVLSGLHGLLRPLDRILPYRLEMGTRLENKAGRDLYEFWSATVTKKLNETMDQHGHRVLINLASNEYYKVLKEEQIAARIITVNFKEWRRDAYRFVSFSAKKARGLMARYMIDQRTKSASQLKRFDVEGYRFNEALSENDHWIFTRDGAPGSA